MLGGYLPSVLNETFLAKKCWEDTYPVFKRRLILGQKMLGGYLTSVLNVDFFGQKMLGEYLPSVLNEDLF